MAGRAVALLLGVAASLAGVTGTAAGESRAGAQHFGVRVVDDRSGRGVPLVELRTVNQVALVTDSQGWVAFHEPGLMDRDVFFSISAPGYEYPRDERDIAGIRVRTVPGQRVSVPITRTNIAERLYRTTGQGIFRDSKLLGLPTPLDGVADTDIVLGQDSVQAVVWGREVFWLWGDTHLTRYPLGNFHVTAALTAIPQMDRSDFTDAVPFRYFLEDSGRRVRAMMPDPEPGAVWLFGLLTIADPQGELALVAHHSRHLVLGPWVEHGLARFDPAAGVFRKLAVFPTDDTWRHPRGNAFRVNERGTEYFYFAEPFAVTRVPARWDALLDPARYEALAIDPGSRRYAWQNRLAPTTQAEEEVAISEGRLEPADARYQLLDARRGAAVRLHRASIRWNEYRRAWILIGTEDNAAGEPSYIGEVWFGAARDPAGPWSRAVKIASHPRYSFYNPRQHEFMDAAGGRFVFFEGTYSEMFSGNPAPTARYDYNQLMYRLDLADPRLAP
jgi:hypothetical protein